MKTLMVVLTLCMVCSTAAFASDKDLIELKTLVASMQGKINALDKAQRSVNARINSAVQQKRDTVSLETQINQIKYTLSQIQDRLAYLESQTNAAINQLDSRLSALESAIHIDSSGVSLMTAGSIKLDASKVEISAAKLQVNSPTSSFSGVINSDILITNSVTSAVYNPGAGNIW